MKEDIEITETQINTVLDKIGEQVANYHIFEGGFINPIYFLTTKTGKELVFRITHPLPKWKHWKTQNEVVIMEFLRKYTQIPVPIIWDSADTPDLIGFEYILMEKVDGSPLNQIYPKAPDEIKCELITQILDFIIEMRQFTFPKIGSFQNGMLIGPEYDIEAGPFESLNEYFYAAIFSRIGVINLNKRYISFIPRLTQFLTLLRDDKFKLPQYPFVLTQNFEDKNILVKDGKITAVLDFEWSGSYPEYCDLSSIVDFLELEKYPQVEIFFAEQLKKHHMELAQPENIQDLQRIEHLAMCLGSYQAWFVGKEAEGEVFVQKSAVEMDTLLKKYNT